MNEDRPAASTSKIKECLGDDPVKMVKTGPPVNEETATYWLAILKNGLNKENRKELVEKHAITENCTLLQGPTINSEVSVVLTDSAIRQDNFFLHIQSQLGAGISALVDPIQKQIQQEAGSGEILQHLIDSSKILADVHHTISVHRRYLLSNFLDSSAKKVSETSPVDMLLFGENFSQSVKASKEMQKVGLGLKRAIPRPVKKFRSQGNASLNWKRQVGRKRKKEEGNKYKYSQMTRNQHQGHRK